MMTQRLLPRGVNSHFLAFTPGYSSTLYSPRWLLHTHIHIHTFFIHTQLSCLQKRISNYGLPAMASPLRGQSRKRNGNTPPSQQPRQINDLLHDASTSDPALMTCKRPEPGFNADRAGESNDCGTFSVDDDQESQKVEGQQVVRRVSGDGDDDGQVGPSKDIRGFESLIDDARRTENKGNGTRSCRSCHHKVKPYWIYGASRADMTVYTSPSTRAPFFFGHRLENALESLRLTPSFSTVSGPAIMKYIAFLRQGWLWGHASLLP